MKQDTYTEQIGTLEQELKDVRQAIETVRGRMPVGTCDESNDMRLKLFMKTRDMHIKRIALEEELFVLLQSREAVGVVQEKFNTIVGDSTTYHEVEERLWWVR